MSIVLKVFILLVVTMLFTYLSYWITDNVFFVDEFTHLADNLNKLISVLKKVKKRRLSED